MKIIIYGRKGHAHTVAFKNYLRMAEIPFTYKDVATDEEAKTTYKKNCMMEFLKYPTVFIDNNVYLTPTSDEFNNILKEASLKG